MAKTSVPKLGSEFPSKAEIEKTATTLKSLLPADNPLAELYSEALKYLDGFVEGMTEVYDFDEPFARKHGYDAARRASPLEIAATNLAEKYTADGTLYAKNRSDYFIQYISSSALSTFMTKLKNRDYLNNYILDEGVIAIHMSVYDNPMLVLYGKNSSTSKKRRSGKVHDLSTIADIIGSDVLSFMGSKCVFGGM